MSHHFLDLQEDSNEVDFGDFFACQTVNISFAISTNQHRELSDFSPEMTLEIFNDELDGERGYIYHGGMETAS